MARYRDYSYEQTKLIAIAFSNQILPGTFEHTLNYLIDKEFDLSVFEQRYHNDETAAPALRYGNSIPERHAHARWCSSRAPEPVVSFQMGEYPIGDRYVIGIRGADFGASRSDTLDGSKGLM